MDPEDEDLLGQDEGNEEDQQLEGDVLDDASLDDADDQAGDDLGDIDPADAADEGEREQEVNQRPRSRAQTRVETALREAREARERAERLERQLNELSTGNRSAEEARQEAERVAAMDPYERSQYEANRRFQNVEQTLAQIRFESADANDKAEFAAKAARTPALAAITDEVEKALRELRAKGQTAPRETIATFLIGQRALTRASGARTRAAKAGAERIARNTARPTGARSDVRAEGPRGDTRQARSKRLENLSI